MKPHKWAKEIKAWADGAEIECRNMQDGIDQTGWYQTGNPNWTLKNAEFRIKPTPKDLKEKIERIAAKVLSEGFSTRPKEPQYLFAYRTNEGIKFSETYYGYTEDVFLGAIELKELLHETT
jgi:hypothetical protein